MRKTLRVQLAGRIITVSLHLVRRKRTDKELVSRTNADTSGRRIVVATTENPKNPFYSAFTGFAGHASEITYEPDLNAILQNQLLNPDTLFLLHQLEPHLQAFKGPGAECAQKLIATLKQIDNDSGPLIYVWHNKRSHNPEFAEHVGQVEAWIFKSPRWAIVTLSSEAREAAIQLGVDARRVTNIHHPAVSGHGPLERIEAARRKLKLPPAGPVFLVVGEHRASKTLGGFAPHLLRETLGEIGGYLVLVGEGVSQFWPGGHDKRVIIRDRPLSAGAYGSYLNSATYVVIPAQESAWVSSSVITALSYGKPVIAPSTLQMSDYLLENENAIFYDPVDPSSLANAFRQTNNAVDRYPHFVVNAEKIRHADTARGWARFEKIIEQVQSHGR